MSDNIGVRVTGDVSDLQRALGRGGAAVKDFSREGARDLDQFGDAAGRAGKQAISLNDILALFSIRAAGRFAWKAMTGELGEFEGAMVSAQQTAQKLRNTLAFAVGKDSTARDMVFLRETTKELGLEFVSTAQQYARLAASSRGTNMEGAKTRDLFEAIAQASSVLGLSVEESEGSFRAVQQMMSKGKVQAEELRGQLGERLPGAFQIAARAMGVTTGELDKMLERGEIFADQFLPRFASQLKKEMSDSLGDAANSAQAASNRFTNAYTEFKQALADAGAYDVVAKRQAVVAESFSVMAQEMRQAKKDGDGLISSLLRAFAADIHLTNPFTGISYSLQENNIYLRDAQKELGRLMAMVSNPNEVSNIYWKEEVKNVKNYIAALEEAIAKQNQQRNADKPDPRDAYSQFPSRYQSVVGEERRQAADRASLDHLSQQLSGQSATYQAKLTELYRLYTVGQIKTLKDYQEKVALLVQQEGGIKKPEHGLSASGQAIKSMSEMTAALRMEQAAQHDLTGAQKLASKVLDDLRTGVLKGTLAERIRIGQALEAMLVEDKANTAREKAVKLQAENAKIIEKNGNAEIKANEARMKALEGEIQTNEHMREEIALIGLDEGQRSARLQVLEEEAIARLQLDLVTAQNIENNATEVAAIEREIRLRRDRITLLGQKSFKDQSTAQAESLRQSREESELLQLEFSLVGQTAEVRDRMLAIRKAELALAREIERIDQSGASSEDKERLKADARAKFQIDSANAANKAVLDEWNRTADSINSSLTDALLRGFESGETFASNFRNTLSNMFKTLVLRPIISAAMSPISGAINSVVGSFTSSMMGGAAQGMGLSATGLGAGIASLFGGGGAAASLGGPITMANAVGPAAGALVNGASVGGSAAAGGAGALGAIPVAGWIAMAAYAAYKIWGQAPGGPKTESSYDPANHYDSFGRTADATGARGYSTGISTAYAGIAQQLGLLNTKLDVGVHYAMDPKGDAPTQLNVVTSSGYSRGGRYGTTENVARGEEALQKEIADETVRAIYHGLQHSDLAQKFKDYLGQLDIGAPAAELQARLDDVLSVKGVISALEPLGGAFAHIGDLSFEATKALLEAAGGMETLVSSSGAYYENFYTAAEKEGRLRQSLTESLAASGVALPATRAAYRALVDAQDLATESGRATAAMLLKNAGAFAQLVPELQAVQEVVQEIVVFTAKDARDLFDAYLTATSHVESAKAAIRDMGAQLQSTVDGIHNSINELRGRAAQELARATETAQQGLASFSSANAQAQQDLASAQAGLHNALEGVARAIVDAASQVSAAEEGVQAARDQITAGYLAALQEESAIKEEITQAYIDAQAAVVAAQERVTQAQQGMARALRSAGDSVLATLRALAGTSAGTGSIKDQYRAQRNQVQSLYDKAMAGDTDAAGKLGGAVQSFVGTSKKASSSASGAREDDIWARQLLGAVMAKTGTSGSGGGADDGKDAISEAQEALAKAIEKATAAQDLAVTSGAGLVLSNKSLAERLAAASIEVARWSSAITVSGAKTTVDQTNLLAQYNTALANLTAAQNSQTDLLAATQGFNLTGIETSASAWQAAVDAATAAQGQLSTADSAATTASNNLRDALALAAEAGITFAAVKTPLEQFSAAIEALQLAQDNAVAVQADLYDAGASLVEQYGTLQSSLASAETELANFQTRVAGIDLTDLRDALGELLSNLNTATSEQDAAYDNIKNSAFGQQINGRYQTLLGRDADKQGMLYWFEKMANGWSLDQVTASMANSAEFQGKYTTAGADVASITGALSSFDGTDAKWRELIGSARTNNVSSTQLDAAMGVPQGTALNWAIAHGLPAFEVGTNRVPRDMLAWVHENEMIVPEKFNPALLQRPPGGSRGQYGEVHTMGADDATGTATWRGDVDATLTAIAVSSDRTYRVLKSAMAPEKDGFRTREAA